MATSSSSSSSSSSSYRKVLTSSTINPHILKVEYAVRGALSNKANEYAQTIADAKDRDDSKLPFDSVVTANIGNPQQQPFLAQKPLTFWRQIAALTEYPALLDQEALRSHFPKDAQARAKAILQDVGSVGAYSHSKGAPSIRKHVQQFIQQRDGHPSDSEMIYLTTGASGGVSLLMSVLISGPQVGVMIPIPQYPLYSATLSYYNATPVPYQLDAHDDWSVNVEAMAKAVDEARKKGTDVRACVIINPGNPTGSCLSLENIQDIIRMAHDKGLVLFADEVYQANIFQPSTRPFVSFKKVLKDFGKSSKAEEKAIADDVELVSFHSISKGVSGECGRRGGYFELCNIGNEVEAQIYKMASVNLCSGLQGQIGVDLLVCPPKEGEESYALYKEEVQGIHDTLKSRSLSMSKAFNALEGVECNEAQGALYLFPQITLPIKAVKAAEDAKQELDLWYCFRLLDATGICCVPGSGFGKEVTTSSDASSSSSSSSQDQNQKEADGKEVRNRFWFRTTILAKETDAFVDRFGNFHKELIKTFQ